MIPADLRDLQSGQQKHDQLSHWDIVCLPAQDRIKHMVLHFAKYVGRLAGGADDAEFRRTLVDTFIIVLASANALNIDIGTAFKPPNWIPSGQQASDLTTSEFLVRMARTTGSMAKACEALDHVEAFDIRSKLEEGVMDLATLCVIAAEVRGIDLGAETRAQWHRIESRQRSPTSQIQG
jgi:hypothetical protein